MRKLRIIIMIIAMIMSMTACACNVDKAKKYNSKEDKTSKNTEAFNDTEVSKEYYDEDGELPIIGNDEVITTKQNKDVESEEDKDIEEADNKDSDNKTDFSTEFVTENSTVNTGSKPGKEENNKPIELPFVPVN